MSSQNVPHILRFAKKTIPSKLLACIKTTGKYTDMDEDLQVEVSDMSVIACEKFSNNYESAAKMIKEAMEKRFGPMWHAVVGESYGFEVTHDASYMMHMYYGGNVAIVVWKI